MVMKSKFKTGDKVIVVSGSNKGAVGTILKVCLQDLKVFVQGVNMRKKRKKSKVGLGDNDAVEYPINQSNVMHIDPKISLPTKIGYKIVDGKKVRFSRKSGELIDV